MLSSYKQIGVGLMIRTWILVLICNIITASALQCYQCNSNSDRDCTEKFDYENSEIKPVDCNVFEARYCVKTTGLYKGEVGTQRFCTSYDWGDICEIVKRKGDIREYRSCLYTCSTDGCNSAPFINAHINLYIMTVSVSVLAFFLHYR